MAKLIVDKRVQLDDTISSIQIDVESIDGYETVKLTHYVFPLPIVEDVQWLRRRRGAGRYEKMIAFDAEVVVEPFEIVAGRLAAP